MGKYCYQRIKFNLITLKYTVDNNEKGGRLIELLKGQWQWQC